MAIGWSGRAILLALLSMVIASGCHAGQVAQWRERGTPIFIYQLSSSKPNSVGGVGPHVRFINSSDKTYKYVDLTAVPYNDVHDAVRSSIGNKSNATVRNTGPFRPDDKGGGWWGATWYNWSITCVQLERVEITFMDGSEFVADGSEKVAELFKPGLSNDCLGQ
ncbi:MAG: hypothetical protein LN413_00080 [Candidatus Thermoplasmatota archaeon]|nr:hypothetical protein [Candidatus Thermoplasmatota archaeon]